MDFFQTQLEWDDFYWYGSVAGPLFNNIPSEDFELHVGTEDEEEIPPHPSQVEAWKKLLETPEAYADLILKGLFEYYLKMRPNYLRAGGQWAENMPELAAPNEIAKLIRLNIVNIGWPYSGPVEVGFSFICQWDGEHGAGIVIKDGEIVDVGGADCLY